MLSVEEFKGSLQYNIENPEANFSLFWSDLSFQLRCPHRTQIVQHCLLLAAFPSCQWPQVSVWAAWQGLAWGEALDPALQPSRAPENQDPGLPVWARLCVTAYVMDRKEHSSALTKWLEEKMGERLLLAVKS